jgi:hypothetical protein
MLHLKIIIVSLPLEISTEKGSTQVGSGLTHKYWTRTEVSEVRNALAYCVRLVDFNKKGLKAAR